MAELQEPESQWDAATAITLMRIYDMLTLIALDTNFAAAKKLIALHEDGKIFNSLPAFNMSEEE